MIEPDGTYLSFANWFVGILIKMHNKLAYVMMDNYNNQTTD